MKSGIRSLMLVTLVALSLTVTPALSAPFGGHGGRGGMVVMADRGSGDNMEGFMGPDGRGMAFCHSGGDRCPAFNDSGPKGMPVVHSGNGFAISGSDYQVLDLKVRGQVDIDPAKFEDIVSEEKTLGQIRSDIEAAMDAAESDASYNGSLNVGDDWYVLRNIRWTALGGENATLDADVAGPLASPERNISERGKFARHNVSSIEELKARFESERAEIESEMKNVPVAGHITMNVAKSGERNIVGQGQLTLSGSEYDVLINMGPVRKAFKFMKGGHGMDGMGIQGMGPREMGMGGKSFGGDEGFKLALRR